MYTFCAGTQKGQYQIRGKKGAKEFFAAIKL